MLRRVLDHVRHQPLITRIEYVLIAAIVTVATTFAVSAAGFSLADIF